VLGTSSANHHTQVAAATMTSTALFTLRFQETGEKKNNTLENSKITLNAKHVAKVKF